MYKVTVLPTAEKSLKKLDKATQIRIAEKIDWVAVNADIIIHHQLSAIPDDLKGLCKLRVGDYRILYWIYHHSMHLKIYNIEHRSEAYRSLRK